MTRTPWSGSETAVRRRVRTALESDDAAVLATLVDVEGSAYRRPGAKMAFDAAGDGVGAITAGCLEDDLRRAAAEVRTTGRPRLETYDLREGEDDVWGLGVGCNGRLEILLEPIDERLRPAVAAFDDGRDVAAVTVLADDGPLERGDRAYYHPDEGRLEAVDGTPDAWPADALEPPATALLDRGRGARRGFDLERGDGRRRLEVFVDALAAPRELLVCGSGPDVGPVTELATANGFRVTVAGFRGGVDLAARFPDADRTLTTSPARLREDLERDCGLEIDARTFAVVMSHNFVDDRLAVDELLRSPAPYVGLMGPRERFEEMLEAFDAADRSFEADELERLYTPVGLDLGSGSPYGIAHGIVAEVLAVSNDRDPGHLSAREGPIHDRLDGVGGDR